MDIGLGSVLARRAGPAVAAARYSAEVRSQITNL